MSILDYFPKPHTPSDIQRKVLVELERRWNNSDVFVLNLDVASGKSFLAHTIAQWLASKKGVTAGARICTPTTVLVDQYARDFDTPVAKSAHHYRCSTKGSTCGAWDRKSRCKGCIYNSAIKTAAESPVSISTYHMSMALRKRRTAMIFDEAHRLGGAIRDMSAGKLYPHRVFLPRYAIGDFEQTKDWVNHLTDSDMNQMNESQRDFIVAFKADMNNQDRPLNFYSWGTGLWRGGGHVFEEKAKRGTAVEVPVLTRQPIEIFNEAPIFWAEKQKLVLMSATIGRPDLHELGLDRARPIFIEGDSPIPADHRPIHKDYMQDSMRYDNIDLILDQLAIKLKHYLDTREGRGVIHITYALAKRIKPLLEHERLITHSSSDMREKLSSFLSSDNKVFLVSGMYEGVSLDYDKASWQVISKIPWPSLTDPMQKYRMKEDPDYYAWSTLKNVIQSAGRVCRRPDDYGDTFVIDPSFEKLLGYKHLIPKNFSERIRS